MDHLSQLNKQPFWGDITSSVDWCESNYVVSYYIAEFFNSISSFAMIFCGIFGYLLHSSFNCNRFNFVFFSIFVVGVGSCLFHATLLREFQALDEVPMLYCALTFDFILLDSQYKFAEKTKKMLAATLIGIAIFTSYLVVLTSGTFQFRSFQITYNLVQDPAIYLFYKLSIATKNKDIKILFNKAIAFFVSGGICWFADFLFCDYINGTSASSILPVNFQLHSFWHIFCTISLYHFTLIALLDYSDLKNCSGQLCYIFGFIPVIKLINNYEEKEKLKRRDSKMD